MPASPKGRRGEYQRCTGIGARVASCRRVDRGPRLRQLRYSASPRTHRPKSEDRSGGPCAGEAGLLPQAGQDGSADVRGVSRGNGKIASMGDISIVWLKEQGAVRPLRSQDRRRCGRLATPGRSRRPGLWRLHARSGRDSRRPVEAVSGLKAMAAPLTRGALGDAAPRGASAVLRHGAPYRTQHLLRRRSRPGITRFSLYLAATESEKTFTELPGTQRWVSAGLRELAEHAPRPRYRP